MNLRDWLTSHDMTQEALGRRMQPPVSQGKVSHWLNGTRRMNLGEALQVHHITQGEVGFAELWAMYRQPVRREAGQLPPELAQPEQRAA